MTSFIEDNKSKLKGKTIGVSRDVINNLIFLFDIQKIKNLFFFLEYGNVGDIGYTK